MSDGRYFQTTKRGEIHELREELHSASKEKKKDAVKKVIAAMTVGKADLSTLFPDVVNCIQTSNIELKKLVYLYVLNFAKAQPELAILAVNTFRKDSLDPNPLIRALAVRTMGCIRLPQIVQYLVDPLRRACTDADPYVRKTAAICVAKLYDTIGESMEEHGFISALQDMIGDSNPMVVANAVAALHEISDAAGKPHLKLNDTNLRKLLAALNECSEWGQVFILDAIAAHLPANARDADQIIERITARLSHVNPAVALSAIKVVLKLMDLVASPEVIRSLQKKLCSPLVTLLSSEAEIQYVTLRNINLIVQKRPAILANEVKMFFCKYNDPVYAKMEKLEIMVRLVNERNVDQVLMEFREYASEVDVEFVRKAVGSIGRVAVRLERSAEKCISVLLELIETRVNYVVQEAIVVMKDIFRRYPNRYESVIAALCRNLESLDEAEARASIVWIIGEYAERIDNADELLESFLTNFQDEPANVQLQLLSATVKLFLKKSNASQETVTRVLRLSTEHSDNPDLRDRGYIYWRLLSSKAEDTQKVVLAPRPPINDDGYCLDPALLDRLIENISMLSSVYYKLPEAFVSKLRTVQKPEGDAVSSEDSDAEKPSAAKIQAEMIDQRQYESASGGESSDESSSGRSRSSSAASGDLLDGAAPQASPSLPVAKVQVLQAATAGAGGHRGVEVSACVERRGECIELALTVANRGPVPLSAWEMQVNKNSFGLALSKGVDFGTLNPGQTAEATIALVPNQLNSQTPPPSPLLLQVAMKNNLDIFYMNVPFALHAVLVERAPVSIDVFKEHWQRMGEAKQVSLRGSSSRPLSRDDVTAALKKRNVSYVVHYTYEAHEALFFSCVTTNKLLLLLQVDIQLKGGTGIKVSVRAETPHLLGLIQETTWHALGAPMPPAAQPPPQPTLL